MASIGTLGVVVMLGACSDDNEPQRDPTGEVTESSGAVDVFTIEVGDCIGAFGEEEVDQLPVIPCDEPHDQEVYAAFDIADAEEFPGDEVIDTQAGEQCGAEFESFVGVPYDDSVLYIQYLTPTADSWEQGDREVLCTVHEPDVQTTGTLEGAMR